MSKPILCLDFDGVIHGYSSGWKGMGIIPDDAVPGAGSFILGAMQHYKMAIFSARSKSIPGRIAMRRYMRNVLWDACLADVEGAMRCWSAVTNRPEENSPWTLYDVRDQADQIHRHIAYPWFKPSAFLTIDDRALTFNGDWSDAAYSVERLRGFLPWNKRLDKIDAVGAPMPLPKGTPIP